MGTIDRLTEGQIGLNELFQLPTNLDDQKNTFICQKLARGEKNQCVSNRPTDRQNDLKNIESRARYKKRVMDEHRRNGRTVPAHRDAWTPRKINL